MYVEIFYFAAAISLQSFLNPNIILQCVFFLSV